MVKGKVVIATVYGDVHDIGKNLVGSILKNQVSISLTSAKAFRSKLLLTLVRRRNLDAGLSVLLVTTSRQMAQCAEVLKNEGFSVPLLVGGAAQTENSQNVLPN